MLIRCLDRGRGHIDPPLPSQLCIGSMASQPSPHLSGILVGYFLNYFLLIDPSAIYAYSLFRSGERRIDLPQPSQPCNGSTPSQSSRRLPSIFL